MSSAYKFKNPPSFAFNFSEQIFLEFHFMAPATPTPLFLLAFALSLSTTFLLLSDTLLTFSNEDPNNSLLFIAVHSLFFLLPCTFLSAVLLLLLHVALPATPVPEFFIKRLTMATQVLVSATLLLGAPLTINLALADTSVPGIVKAAPIGLMAAAIICNSFRKYFNLSGLHAGGFVPALFSLCISTGTILLLLSFFNQNHDNPLVDVPIQLLYFFLIFFNFMLGMALLFLRASVPADGPSICTVLIEQLVKMALAIGLATALISLYTVVVILGGIM